MFFFGISRLSVQSPKMKMITKKPAGVPDENWLPAQDGPFSLQGRMYWPKPEALDLLYIPPVVQRVKS